MECQSCDSKKLFKVFDASKRKRTRKKRDGMDDSNSVATDDSNSACQANECRVTSAKASRQNLSAAQTDELQDSLKRDRSNLSITRSPEELYRSSRSPQRQRRSTKQGISLALKAGLVSTPRSISPPQDGDGGIESVPQDQDSFIYAFLEDAIKRDKKKHRHARRHEERRVSRDRDASATRDHRHRHRRHRDEVPSRERDKPTKEKPPSSAVEPAVLFETFAKLCAHMNDNTKRYTTVSHVPRTQSHKSLQCEVASRRESFQIERHSQRPASPGSRNDVQPSRIRSQDNFHGRVRSREKLNDAERKDKCGCCYERDVPEYSSKLDMTRSRMRNDDEYRACRENVPRGCADHCRRPDQRDHPDWDRRRCDDDKRRYCEQKTSRSFEVHRDVYEDDRCRRTTRSDNNKRLDERDKRYDDRREKFHEERPDVHRFNRERASRRHLERIERNSMVSRDDDYKDRYSERERDSGLSVADETSTLSGRSNYLRVVKQEITEQRDAMDKMMKLWMELMRCFKGISHTPGQDKAVDESASNMRESAAAQLRLWRECMRRYETVARDVGDTDARLMEEINKQRSEMSEMASMWQECLQRYRDMSNDFNSLKQKLATAESPTRIPAAPPAAAPAPAPLYAEGEGTAPPAHYRLPPNYPPMGPMASAGYGQGGSPLRSRASAPPAWWWGGEGGARAERHARSPRSPRRRSSPDSRGSRERDRKHRHKDRDESRYKEKPSKPSAARSEHRHRKR